MYLAWEELPKDERPPRRIWLDGEDLTDWFKEVERRREEKYGSGSSRGGSDIDDPVENDAARALIVG